MTAGVYLDTYLSALAPWLTRDDVTDLLINQPGEVWIETTGGMLTRIAAPQVTDLVLGRLARQIAAATHQGVNREQPLLSATLPDGGRVQIIAPPATRGGMAIAIRKHVIADLSVDELAKMGLFAEAQGNGRRTSRDDELAALLKSGDRTGFLKEAVRAKKTIVISGGTSTGKTTLLNALVREINTSERLMVIEDAPEIRLDHPNAVGLIAVRGDQGEAQVDADDLLRASLRMRPDRILLGELRGKEAFAFLRAVNSGHPGSLTTVHADTPEGAIDQIALLAMTSGLDLGWDKIQTYVRRVIDVIVQLERSSGKRRVSEIRFLAGDNAVPPAAND
ncbi:MAG TPA: P-type DNA transfer ATPase VirB11 [Rhizomicrobium sp.]|jgi:type IV secretion system protein VirB11|nr:P-type DNA transfer ATPase VirB11 [Rhizomicrobium sp.]